jgi:hypothetical protein
MSNLVVLDAVDAVRRVVNAEGTLGGAVAPFGYRVVDTAGRDALLFGEAGVHARQDDVSSQSEVPQRVVDPFFGDGSVSNASIAARQKVVDLSQRVADSFFGFGDASEARRVRMTSPKESHDLSGGHHDAFQRVGDASGPVESPRRSAADAFQKVRCIKRLIQWTL